MRISLVVLMLAICAGSIAAFFWNQDLKYSLPTPVPTDYVDVLVGQPVTLSNLKSNQSYFLHFYSADCPCSRFNARHVKSLIRSYGDSLNVVIIVASPDDIEKAKKELGDDLDIRVDINESIAKACGVYSTPQAAIIDRGGKLYYRGNYNQSRYCTARATNFAELSLIALLNHQPSPSFGLLATQSYGCQIDNNKNSSFLLDF